jgi:hypothetical protein
VYASSVRYGDAEPNVLAVYVDPREGSECHATLFCCAFLLSFNCCCPFSWVEMERFRTFHPALSFGQDGGLSVALSPPLVCDVWAWGTHRA